MKKEEHLTGYKYTLTLWKMKFDFGYGLTSYVKWVAAIFGIGEVVKNNYLAVIGGAVAYVLFCVMIGWAYVKYGWFEVGIEVGNRFNPFVKEMRKCHKKRKTI